MDGCYIVLLVFNHGGHGVGGEELLILGRVEGLYLESPAASSGPPSAP